MRIKALQLPRRRRSVCGDLQLAAARFGADSPGGGRSWHSDSRMARSCAGPREEGLIADRGRRRPVIQEGSGATMFCWRSRKRDFGSLRNSS